MKNKVHKETKHLLDETLNLKCKAKVNKSKHLTIEERIESYSADLKKENDTLEPFDWGKDQGKEKFY